MTRFVDNLAVFIILEAHVFERMTQVAITAGSTPIAQGFGQTPGRRVSESTSDPRPAPHLHRREPSQTIRDGRREVEYIRGKTSRGGKRTDKQLVDGALTLDANGWRGEEVAQWVAITRRTEGPLGGKRDGWAIVKRTSHPACLQGCSPDLVRAKEPA